MATVSHSPLVLPGHFPAFATVTPTDHSAWILIATILGLVCTLVFGALRVLVRVRSIGLDDYVLTPAIGLAIIQSSLVLGACAEGFGKVFHLISENHQVKVQQLFYTSNIFATIILGLSKLSVPLILLKLSPINHHKITFYVSIGGVVALTIASVLTIALQCGPTTPWLSVGKMCQERVSNNLIFRQLLKERQHLQWRVILALDIFSEVWMMSLPVYVVWGLQTTLSRKRLVVGAFVIRIA
jgi:hypothetical protein